MVANQGLRVVQEHAVGLAVFILRDLTAKGIWGVAINSRELEGSGINDGPVTVSASQDHRIVGRDLVEIGAGRKDWGLPKRFDPASAHNPLAGFGGSDALLYLREQIVKALGSLEIKAELARANAQEVVVRVGQPG